MRRLLVALGLVGGLLSPAFAADYDLPILRGSQPVPVAPVTTVGPATFTRWSGIYFGGDIGVNDATTDFVNSTQPLLAFSLRNLTLEEQVQPSTIPVLGKGSAVVLGGGAFFGYNTQWQDLILGVEANYTHTNLNTTAASSPLAGTATSPSRVFSAGGASYNVALFGTGNLDLTDYGEARFRAGYIVGAALLSSRRIRIRPVRADIKYLPGSRQWPRRRRLQVLSAFPQSTAVVGNPSPRFGACGPRPISAIDFCCTHVAWNSRVRFVRDGRLYRRRGAGWPETSPPARTRVRISASMSGRR